MSKFYKINLWGTKCDIICDKSYGFHRIRTLARITEHKDVAEFFGETVYMNLWIVIYE